MQGSYTLHLIDDNGLPRDYEADARVLVDPVPNARLLRPTANGVYVQSAEIPFRMLAEDEIFAVKSVYLEVVRKNVDGTLKDKTPTRIPLYDPKTVGDAMRALTGSLVPFERIVPMQPRRLELAMLWQLRKQYQVGDILSVQMCADDYCDLFTPRLPGRSTTIEMRIVSDDELAQQHENVLADVQKDLKAIQQIEEKAKKELELLPKDQKPDAKVLDQLIEAGQEMKTAQERIGLKSDEGVRDKLEKMQQSMKDNKVNNPEMQDQVRGMSQELQRLVQEEFPKVEQQLNELRKQAAGVEQPKNDKNDKNDKGDKNGKNDKEQSKSALDKAKETSKEIDKTISDLSQALNRWADLSQIKGKLRELIDQQKQLAGETEKINDTAEKLRNAKLNDDDNKMTPEERKQAEEKTEKIVKEMSAGDRQKLAEQQAALEKDVKDLLKQIGEVKAKKDEVARQDVEEGDKDAKTRQEEAADTSKRLAGAKAKANSENLNQEMQQAAKSLDGNKTERCPPEAEELGQDNGPDAEGARRQEGRRPRSAPQEGEEGRGSAGRPRQAAEGCRQTAREAEPAEDAGGEEQEGRGHGEGRRRS